MTIKITPPPFGEAIPVRFERDLLGVTGQVRGEGIIRFQPTSMTIDAEWAGISWSREEQTIHYRRMMKVRRSQNGIDIRLSDAANTRAEQKWVYAVFPPDQQLLADALAAWLTEKLEYPECWSCHAEIDLETHRCVACGKSFAKGVRQAGIYQLTAAVGIGVAGWILSLYPRTGDWFMLAYIVAAITALFGILNLAGGKGLRG
jgi:hypothetical protein